MNFILKKLATELGPEFAHLFQQSLTRVKSPENGLLPTYHYKKGNIALACNYRPASSSFVPCKLVKYIVCSNIMAHLDEHRILSDRRHAFRKSHSCESRLTTVINDWTKILDKTGQVDTFILDFEKAFDKPPHKLLKYKLLMYDTNDKALVRTDSFF